MKISIWPLLLLLLVSSSALAQKPRRGTVSRKPPTAVTPQPTPTPAQPVATPTPAPRPPSAPIPLVTVNGQTISTSDLDPAIRQQVEIVDARIADARRGILDLQINTTLLELEAKRRRITSHQLYVLEVEKRIPNFTPAQIKQFLDDNKDEFRGIDEKTAISQAAAIMHDEAESRLGDGLVLRLRKTTPVLMVADLGTPNLSPETTVATVGGQPIKAGALLERLKPIVYKLRSDAYLLARGQAEQMVDDLLLIAEANKRNIGPEAIVRTEVSEKMKPPTEAEVAKFYEENKARIGGDLNTVRNQIANYLQSEERKRLEKEMSERLRKSANIKWLITEPQQPVQLVSVDDDPSTGPANAPVTIVEFTDFQCPACAAMHPVLEETLKSYGNRVRFVVRDFPLQQHEWARKAAEAANAAKAQGKFFEYIALLFKRQKALDVPSLKKYASELGLNRAKFDAELDGGVYASEVKHDLDDGEIYGVGSTPSIFINGVLLKVLSEEGLRAAIDRAAAAATNSSGSPR